jgi:hypothetical protein
VNISVADGALFCSSGGRVRVLAILPTGAPWLNGDATHAVACGSAVIPVVTGGVDLGVLDDRVSLSMTPANHLTPQARQMIKHAISGETMILLLHSRSALDLRISMGRTTSAAP